MRNRFVTHLPDWKGVKAVGEQLTISEPIENPYQGELNCFNDLVGSGDLDGLIARYPLKHSNVLDRIAQAMRCAARADYERMVVARVREDDAFAQKLKDRIKPLTELLDAGT